MACNMTNLCPTVVGYGYAPDAGLSRIEMQDGVVRQRRKWSNGRYLINLRFELTRECLSAADAFFEAIGANWFTIDLITGKTGPDPVMHTVRLVDDPVVKMMAGQRMFEYLLSVETQD